MSKKMSIIVAIYNSEDYLKKCLESLVNQTLQDVEIILIDDNSKDKSIEIINEYYEKYRDKIIPIFLSENKKQGFARNIGIKRATGEYIAFVDSDDYISKDMCEVLYSKAKEENYDIVCFDFYNVVDDKETLTKLVYNSCIDGIIDEEKRSVLMDARGYFWTRIYKREMLINNNIKFPTNLFYEDSPFNTLALLYSNSISKVDKGFYFYLNRDNSSSNCRNKERIYDRINVLEFMMQDVKNRGIYKEYKSIIDKKYFKMLVGNIHLCLDMFDNPSKDKLRCIYENLNKNIKLYTKNEQYKSLDRVSKLYIKLSGISPKILIKIDKLYKFIIKLY